MNANDVLIDLLSDNQRRLHRVMDAMNDDCLYWTPDPEANCIAVTVWHMGRLLDVFLTRYAQEKEAGKEAWFSRGWAERTGYDPRGLGRDGWGSVNDYSREEVAAIPRFSRQDLLGYSDDVADRVIGFLSETRTEELLQAGAGFEGKYTRYQLIQMPLLDNVRHLGEVFALKAMWERRAGHAEP
jgi:hypothetical protein